jgi:hypothetical protein
VGNLGQGARIRRPAHCTFALTYEPRPTCRNLGESEIELRRRRLWREAATPLPEAHPPPPQADRGRYRRPTTWTVSQGFGSLWLVQPGAPNGGSAALSPTVNCSQSRTELRHPRPRAAAVCPLPVVTASKRIRGKITRFRDAQGHIGIGSLRMRPLPRPMLLRPGGIPSGGGWAFELKHDGFRS